MKKALAGCLIAALVGLPGMAFGGMIQHALEANLPNVGAVTARIDIIILGITAIMIAIVAIFGDKEEDE